MAARLTTPDPSVPNVKLQLLNPKQTPNYKKAYQTVRIMLKAALLKATEVQTSIADLKQMWLDAMPNNSTDVGGVLTLQETPYRNLTARLGKHLPDEERVLAIRKCMTAALQAEFDDQLARAHITTHRMPWAKCMKIAKNAQKVHESRVNLGATKHKEEKKHKHQQLIYPQTDDSSMDTRTPTRTHLTRCVQQVLERRLHSR